MTDLQCPAAANLISKTFNIVALTQLSGKSKYETMNFLELSGHDCLSEGVCVQRYGTDVFLPHVYFAAHVRHQVFKEAGDCVFMAARQFPKKQDTADRERDKH